MEHRKLTLIFEKGEIKGALLNADLNKTYKSLFDRAYQAAGRSSKSVSNGIKVVIFGSFWLESYANETMRVILNREIASLVIQKNIWKHVKRISLQEKLEFFYKTSPSNLKHDFDKINKNVKDLFDLRNRLAHFKDEPAEVELDIDFDEANKVENKGSIEKFMAVMAKGIPVPDINQQIMWPKVEKHAKTVLAAAAWLKDINELSNKAHKIESKKMRFRDKKNHNKNAREGR